MLPVSSEPPHKILVATDFSECAQSALEQGVALAEAFGGQLTVAHVLTDLRQAIAALPYSARWELIFGDIDVFERAVRAESQARLQKLIEPYLSRCPVIKTETLLGKPAFALVHAVQAEGHDMVVAGTRGLSGWGRLLMGSTARQLIRECPSAVWVTKGERHTPLQRMLVAVDFSEVSLRALHLASQLAKSSGAMLDVLHVIEMPDVLSGLGTSQSAQVRDSDLGRKIEADARERLQKLTSSTELPSQQVNLHVVWDNAWESIVNHSRLSKSELIVIGTCGRVGVAGFMLGNTAEQVLQECGCDVLTVKPTGFISRIAPAVWELHPQDEVTPR